MSGLGLVTADEYLQHETGNHPECPDRLRYILDLLSREGVMDRVVSIRPKPAPEEEILAVHTPRYFGWLKDFVESGGRHITMDTPVCQRSFAVALLAAGGALGAVDAVMMGVKRVFALVRPPGHHAEPGAGMGFCLFNNIAIAASYAQRRYGLERILVVDWDLHHGNGTEKIFYEEPEVLFFSTHLSPAYPGTGWITDVGAGRGEGYNINVPLPTGTGDGGYQRIFDEVLVPVARAYRPDLIMISAGQDGHWADPLGDLSLTAGGYGALAATISRLADELCQGRVVATLEGGYHLEAQAYSVLAIINALGGFGLETGDPASLAPRYRGPRDEGGQAPWFRDRLAEVKKVQSRYWPCLNGKD